MAVPSAEGTLSGMTTIHAESRPTSRSDLAAWYEAALDEQKGSGLSVAEYADEIGVTATTLYSWRRRLESSPPGPQGEAAGLVRVQVCRNVNHAVTPAALVVRVGNDRAIEIPPGFDAEDLVRVIEVLEAC